MCIFILCAILILLSSSFFFFNDTATTEIYTLSLHDALPILENLVVRADAVLEHPAGDLVDRVMTSNVLQDRKSTRLNSSHQIISYAVFCLKKKNKAYISRWKINVI